MATSASTPTTPSTLGATVRSGVRDRSSVWWWFLALGIAKLSLRLWAVRSWQRSLVTLVTLVTLVGVWAIVSGVAHLFAAFSIRQTGRRVTRRRGWAYRRDDRLGACAWNGRPVDAR